MRGLAEAYTNVGNFRAAEAAYKKAIDLRPNYWSVYSRLGLFYFGQQRYAEAAEMFLKVTQLAPDSYQGYLTLGGAYVAEGRYQDAVDSFKRSIDLRPNPDAYNNLAYAYTLMHRYPDAIVALEQALKIDDSNPEIWGNLGAALYWSQNQREQADARYQKAISLADSRLQVNPHDAEMLSYVANYSAMVGDRKAAFSYLERALTLAPADGEVLFRAAVVYNHFNQTDQTIAYLSKATKVGYSPAIIRDSPDFTGLQQNLQFKGLLSGRP